MGALGAWLCIISLQNIMRRSTSMMMTDSPVTWAVLAVLAAVVFGKWFLHYVNSKQKPAPYQVQKDEDLIFFD